MQINSTSLLLFLVLSLISCAVSNNASQQRPLIIKQNAQSVRDFVELEVERERLTLNQLDCALIDKSCLGKEIVERFRIDQWIRAQFVSRDVCGHYREQNPKGCRSALIKEMVFNGDMPNTARLKDIIMQHGWPDTTGWGPDVENAAWYLVQHSQIWNEGGSRSQWDVDFAKSVLPKIKTAMELGHLTPWHYAAMFDRIALNDGRQQRYGTQFSCVDGINRIENLEEPETLNERRKEIGMELIENHRLYEKPCDR